MIVDFIQAVYQLLWGDLITIPLPGGSSVGLSLLILILVPSGIYFTIKTRLLPIRMFPEMLRLITEKKTSSKKGALSGRRFDFRPSGTDYRYGNACGHGKSGRRSGCHLSRRRRGSFLDVGTGAARFFYCFYRSNPGTAPQRTRSPVRRLPGRPRILHPSSVCKERWQTAPFGNCLIVCHIRAYLLVRHQPGYRQFRFLCL